MARVDWIEERLQNWALWKVARGAGQMGYAQADLGGANGGRSGYVTAAVPILDAEAAATDDAVGRLNPRGLYLTVLTFYCEPGGHKEKAAKLFCSVAAMYARVDPAHRQLADHFLAQQDRQKAERARVEALQRGSFPR
jgi:hypothetical protein